MPRGSALIRRGVVRLEVGEPIATAGLRTADREALIARGARQVAAMLGEAPGDARGREVSRSRGGA